MAVAREHLPDRGSDKSPEKSWRDHLKVHPAAELFPLMSREELLALGEDIRARGLAQPIALWRDEAGAFSLLDGRNRLEAMELVGLPIIVGDEAAALEEKLADHVLDATRIITAPVDPYDYVVSLNLHRRHLTAERRRDLIAELLKATPEKSDRQIAETVKASPTTVGKVRAEMEPTVQSGQLPKRVGADGKARRQPVRKRQATPPASEAERISKKIEAFHREVLTFIIEFRQAFDAWLATRPSLTDEAKAKLREAFDLWARGFARLSETL